MKISTTMGSLFDGSGGFPLGGLLHGIEPVWASEVEPYPIAVTKLHFPNMKHLGDVSKIHGDEIDPVDVVTFGSPCQDMSIAGKRAGLLHTAKGDDTTTRSGLFYEAIRIMKEMREATHGKYPSFAVWENVPGALTSAKGEDFRCVLQELLQIAEGGELSVPRPANGKWLHAGEILADHCSIAWRILDAQYWGVPQRRKRIYLVADFSSERAGEILFERESMRGYFETCGAQGQGVASDSQASSAPDDRTGEAGRGLDDIGLDLYNHAMTVDKAATLTSTMHKGGTNSGPTVCYQTPYMLKVHTGVAIDSAGKAAGKVALVQEDKAMTLATTQDQYLFQPVPDVMLDDQGGQQIGVRTDGKSPTLMAEMHGNIPCVVEAGGFCPEQSAKTRGLGLEEEMSPTLRAGVTPEVVAGLEPTVFYAQQAIAEYKQSEVASNQTARQYKSDTDLVCCVDCRNLTETQELYQTLQAKSNGGHSLNYSGAVRIEYIVRRLTPLECNRLQGFPDYWGTIPHKEAMTDEEYQFWTNVRIPHIAINGKTPKSFTKKAMLEWYNKLHTDSAEYKMWGNGVAEPCVCFVMDGIARAMAEQCGGPCNIGKECSCPMRENRVNLTRYGISRFAYQELKAFCRQYPEKKAMAEACIMPGASERIGSGGGLPGDPVSRAAAARERYLRDTDTIDRAARETGGGQWARALLLNACYGVGYEYLDPAILPSSNRNAFFHARREFFWRLYHLRFDTFGAVKT